MVHALKTVPMYFEKMLDGDKTFEIRKDDRPFKVGEMVILQEYSSINLDGSDECFYTGRELEFFISNIFRDEPKFGLKAGFVILSLRSK